jgi:hypothetical protein
MGTRGSVSSARDPEKDGAEATTLEHRPAY